MTIGGKSLCQTKLQRIINELLMQASSSVAVHENCMLFLRGSLRGADMKAKLGSELSSRMRSLEASEHSCECSVLFLELSSSSCTPGI